MRHGHPSNKRGAQELHSCHQGKHGIGCFADNTETAPQTNRLFEFQYGLFQGSYSGNEATFNG
jgi:hypothetical protein